MKKIIALFLTVFAIGSFVFAGTPAENYLSHFESLVTKVESAAANKDASGFSSYEAQKQEIDAERETVTLSLTQRFTDWRYTGRYNSAIGKLKAESSKETASSNSEKIKEKAGELKDSAKEKAGEVAGAAKETANEKLDSAKNTLNEKLDSLEEAAKEKVQDKVNSKKDEISGKVNEKAGEIADATKDKAGKAKEKTDEKVKSGTSKVSGFLNNIFGTKEDNANKSDD